MHSGTDKTCFLIGLASPFFAPSMVGSGGDRPLAPPVDPPLFVLVLKVLFARNLVLVMHRCWYLYCYSFV